MPEPAESPIHYIDLGPWPGHVGFTMSADDFAAEMKRLDIDDGSEFLPTPTATAAMHAWTSQTAGLVCIITLGTRKGRSREMVAALLAHEAVHVVQEMREVHSKGHPLGSEAEAYLVQHIVQSCLQVAWNTGRTKRVVPHA